ncbi:MAG: LytR C-terminal domain-containing protein [Acidimicrobiales bacterium]
MTATEARPVSVAAGQHFVRRGPSRRWMHVFLSSLALVVIAATLLTYVGIKTVRSSRAGHVVTTVTDPAAPGFEALLEPSPTLALLHVEAGQLRSMAVLGLGAGDVGGSVLAVSPRVWANPGDLLDLAGTSAFGGGPEAVLPPLQRALDFGVAEVAIVDDARWAELVAPVEPIQLDNPSPIGRFPAGPTSLTAADVGEYLAATEEGEEPQLQANRQRAFYGAWLGALAASDDPAPVTGEVEAGLSRFVSGLASGPVRIETAPTTRLVVDGTAHTYVDHDAMAGLVPDLIPFPVAGEPVGRVRVRLLDGTGDDEHVQRAAPLVIPADAEIVLVGNADRLDHDETEIRYHNPLAKAAATNLQASLGAGRVIDDPRQTDAFDVTIVLGSDL